MNLIKKSVSGLAGVVACLGLAAASASAQQAQFTLPMEAHWGKAVLEPGKYLLKFPSALDPTPIIRIVGNGTTVSVLLQARTGEEYKAGDTGKMILRDVDGRYIVESVQDPLTQETFLFPIKKAHEAAATAANPQQGTRVAVQIKKIGQ